MAENIPHRLSVKHSLSLLIDIDKRFGFEEGSNVSDINECISFLSSKGEFESYRFINHLECNGIKNITYEYFSDYLNKTYSPVSEKDDEFVEFSLNKLNIENKNDVRVFLNAIDKIGVYILSKTIDINKDSVYYVGKSINLKSRILSSITERKIFNKCDYFYVSVIDTYNKIDSSLIELYLINKYNPELNREGKHQQKSSIISEVLVKDIKQIKVKIRYE